MQNKRHIQAVIFDLDDTLIDWSGQGQVYYDVVRPHVDNMHQHLAAAGHPVPDPDTFSTCFRETVADQWRQVRETWSGISFESALQRCLATLGVDPSTVDLTAVMQAYDARPVPGVVLFPDTIPVLRALHQRGYLLGLVTNSMMPMWMRDAELSAYELLPYLDFRVSSGDIGYLKPHPEIFRHVVELLQIRPEEAVFVGDRPVNDIAGANEAGMISVLISPPHLNRELNGVQPDYIIKQLSELLPILDELEAGLRQEGKNG
jgi:putative hydrolase of the HAD superfamily